MDVTVKVEGLKEIEDALAAAGPKLARGAVVKALKKGGAVFLARAKARAPILAEATPNRRPGELRDAIAEVDRMDPRKQQGRARVGLKYNKAAKKGSQDPGVYGLFVEFGTKNMAAQPYMRPAFDEAKAEAESVFIAEIRAGVAELAKK
jgi:HK97 gp10 family phage protein